MAQTLLTINCDSLITAAAFRPHNIQILEGTRDGDLNLYEIEAPEEESSGSFDSDSFDVENKYNLHTELLAEQSFKSPVRQLQWSSETMLVALFRDSIEKLQYTDSAFSVVSAHYFPCITEFLRLAVPEDRYCLAKINFSKNAKTRALQKAVFEPLKRQKFDPVELKGQGEIYCCGNDSGEVFFIDMTSGAVLFKFHDCGDFVTGIAELDDLVVVISGDGTVYLYRLEYSAQALAVRLEDNSMPEETDFNCLALAGDSACVGTSDGTILVFDVANIITYKEKIKVSDYSIENLSLLPGNILLASSDNGQVYVLSVFPNFKLLGSLAVCESSNGTILALNDDYSLLCIGGGDTKMNIEDMQWYAQELEEKKSDEKTEESFEQEEEVIDLSEDGNSSQMRDKSEEEQESTSSDMLSATDELPPDEVGGHVKTFDDGNEVVKVIEKGHASDDSSFSDFFKPLHGEEGQKEKQQHNTYSKSRRVAQREAFFKDIDSDS